MIFFLYRFFARCLRLPFVFKRTLSLRGIGFPKFSEVPVAGWFHVASAGECEALWTLAVGFFKPQEGFVLTTFSPSGLERIQKLARELEAQGARQVFVGLSPVEGDWTKALKRLKPGLFVTAKYEAWPELWAALALLRVPLLILSTRPRRALSLARKFCEKVLGVLPQLALTSSKLEDVRSLREEFREAAVVQLSDPRWDRIHARAEGKSPEVQTLVGSIKKTSSWFILAQSWIEDLEVWSDLASAFKGEIWVVPHLVSDAKTQFDYLKRRVGPLGQDVHLLSQIRSPLMKQTNPMWVVVDRMGILVELYRSMDGVYVGGGFGQGIHNTMEPAVYGLPVAIGPKGVERFQEVDELQELGQLKVIRSREEASRWIQEEWPRAREKVSHWAKVHQEKRGAAAQILRIARELCGTS